MVREFNPPVWQEVDRFIAAFELAWHTTPTPDIQAFLPPREHDRHDEILLELVRVDLELRWRCGVLKSLDEYRVAFPGLLQDPQALGQVAFEEFRARRRSGDPARAEEYSIRYGLCTADWPELPLITNASTVSRQLSTAPPPTGGPRRESPTFPESGSEFLGFQLQSELGRGAFSRVYLARQGDLANRLVVLKVAAESFAEADKLAQLQHAYIVPIYSIHQSGGLSVVCMPYFGARTLANVLSVVRNLSSYPATGRLFLDVLETRGADPIRLGQNGNRPPQAPTAQSHSGAVPRDTNESRTRVPDSLTALVERGYVDAVLWIGAKLADGLHHSHERGILHRDLKPANVLLADDGRPMLLDYNLSTDLKLSESAREMRVGGTLPYMSPEQIRGFQQQARLEDARSDVFSLGVILYELLTGQPPFPLREGVTEATLTQMLADRRQPPPAIRQRNPAVSRAGEAIILRCLEPDPARRYQSAFEVSEDLHRHLQQLPLRHTPEPSWAERLRKWTRRHSRFTAIATVSLVAAITGLALATYHENERVSQISREIAELMERGREALDQAEDEVAHGRFLAAWMKVQSEPALAGYQSGVAGWLEHSRRAVTQKQWIKRARSNNFESRRDESLVLSLLLEGPAPESLAEARHAVSSALELTLPDDPGWVTERELLTLIDADLQSLQAGPREALQLLEAHPEFASRICFQERARYLDELGRTAEASQARQTAETYPPAGVTAGLLTGLLQARRQDFSGALAAFAPAVNAEPESFLFRLLESICFLRLSRSAEARVALTASIGQRPHFAWSWYFRSQACSDLGETEQARTDLQRVLDLHPSPALERAALARRNLLAGNAGDMPVAGRSNPPDTLEDLP